MNQGTFQLDFQLVFHSTQQNIYLFSDLFLNGKKKSLSYSFFIQNLGFGTNFKLKQMVQWLLARKKEKGTVACSNNETQNTQKKHFKQVVPPVPI